MPSVNCETTKVMEVGDHRQVHVGRAPCRALNRRCYHIQQSVSLTVC